MFSLLYVDDEQGLLDLGQLFLESDGEFRVTTAISGEEGLRILAGQDFDAIVSDYQMPEMNGIEFLKRVRRTHGNLPFILFTGRGREEVVIDAINNGVDFYLQKGGDPRSQFAELAHKVRQAVTRRRAEAALSESEKLLADIINFLPDATFAIDQGGRVIAWNHAIEEMTGIPAKDMLGKGDHEYALPFYQARRPILIDLIFETDEVIEKNYSHISRHKDLLTADTTLPRPKGMPLVLMGVAGPLYDRQGRMIGAIESIRDITERKKAEESLNRSERRFRELADLLPQGIYEADIGGRMTYANRIALEMSGYTAEDIARGLNALSVIAPKDRNRAAEIFSSIVTNGTRVVGRAEYLAVRKDTSTFPVSIYSTPIYQEGKITGVRGVISDITEQKKAEERLIVSNREYTNLLDQIQDIYYFADTEGRLVRASRSMATLLGLDDIAECIGRSIADDFYYNPADRKRLLDELNLKGKVTGFEVLLKKKDGSPVLVEVSSHLSYDQEGHFIGVEGTFHDITARKKAEDELRAAYEQLAANEEELKEQYNELSESEKQIRESELKYRTVFETTGTAMLVIEEDATISLVNEEFSRLSGYPREEIENKKRWPEFVVPGDRDRMLAQHSQRRVEPKTALKQYEFRFVTRSGGIRDILLSIDIIPGTSKSIASLLDITERKKAADEIMAANEQLVATDEELRAQYEELALVERQVRMNETRLGYMLGFYDYAQKSEKELLAYAIEGAGIVTGSPLGYLAFLNDDETELAMYAWSQEAMAECSMVTKPIVYQVEKTGLWGEAVRQRRPVITNDYAAPNPAKKGYPEGHPHIVRHMNVPVMENGHIVLVAGVANKPGDYAEHDVNELLLLMQGLWEILKRRRAEETKQESDAKFRNIIENAPVGMHFYTLEADGSLIFRGANPGADRILGIDHTRFIGKTIETAFPDLVTTEIPEQYRRIAAEGGIWQTDQITYDGQQIHGAFAVTAFRIRPGEMIATFMDITARKQAEISLRAAYERTAAAEEELREQYDSLAAAQAEISARREQLEEITSTVPGVVYQFYARQDGSMGISYASRHTSDVFDLEPELETFFPEFTSRVHPEDRARFLASIEEAIRQRADWRFEGRFIRKSGETIWFEGRSTPVARGDELVYSGVLLDITHRKDMEAAVRESEERYRSLVELSPDAIIVHGGGRVLYANPVAVRLIGGNAPEDIIGREVLPFIHPDDRAMALEDFRLLYEEAKTIPLKEERLLKLNGEPVTVEVTASPIRFQDSPAVLVVIRDVTARKQAEEALAESERKYRTVFETSDEGIWTVDAGFRTRSANRKMQELFGYTEQEMMGRPVWDFVPPDEAESMKQELSKRPEGIPGRYERRWVKKDGTVIWCLTSATPLFSPSGEFLGSFGMFTDITERKQTEDALRASEKKYRLLVENIPFGITLIDADHRIIMSNTAQGQMFHTDAGLWPGRYCYQEFEKRDAVCTHCPGTRAMATGVCEEVETEGVRDDGTRFNARIHAIPLPDDEGKATRFIEVVEDITERKKAENALRQNEEKYRTLIETTGTGFVIIDQDGRVLDANPEYVRLTGHSRLEDITGRSVIEWTAEHERERNAEAVRQCLRDGFIRNFEIDYTARDGTVIPIEINATVLRSKGSVHILTLCRDISDRQRIQDALKTSAEDYQTLLQTAMDGFCIIAMDGSFIDVNEAFCRMLGYSREEAIALTLRDVGVREAAEDTSRRIGNILKKGYDRFETQWQRKDRGIIDVEVSVLYTGTHGGRFITFSRDITSSRRAEQALRESEATLSSIFRAAPTGIGLVVNRVIKKVNDRLCEMTGYSPEELLGKNARILYPSDEDYDFVGREKYEQIREHGTGTVETRWQRRDGRIIDILLSSTPLDPADLVKGVTFTALDITTRKQTETALRESEATLRAVIDQSFQLIGLMTPEGILIDVNRAALALIGTSESDVINRPFWETPWWSHSEALQEKLKDAIHRAANGETVRFEATHPAADGHLAYIDFSVKPVVNPDGRILYLIPEGRDITERRCTEDELFNSRQMLQAVLDSIPQRVFWKDRDLVYLGCNQPLAEDAGYRDPGELIGKTDFDTASRATADLYRADDRKVMETGESKINFEEPQVRPDGSPAWLRTTKVPLRNKTGEIIGVLGTYEDITELKRTEEALRESEEKYRTLVETTSDFIWEVDTTGKYTYVSPQVDRILGYEPGELIGKTPFDFMPPDEAERIAAEFDRLIRSGLPITGLVNRALRKDGSVVILETSGVVRTADDGRFLGYRGIDRDITERTQTEEALREKTEEFNRFFTASLDLFCIADTGGYFRRLNPEWEKTLGYTLSELEGHRFFDFVHPDDLPSTLSAIADLSEQKNVLNFTNRYRHKDGTYRWIEWRSLPVGSLIFAAARDITARHDAAERTARISALKQDLLRTAPLEEKLKRITDTFVDIFGADFARIWISGPGDLCSRGCIHAGVTKGPHICRDRSKCLHLIVSSGRYTHTDGDHRRVPFGAYEIGRIAAGQEAQLITNDVTHDPRIHDHAWAVSLGLVSFAGSRLVSAEGSPIGVLAFFSRLPVPPEIMEDIADMATTASQVIQTGMAEDALRQSGEWARTILNTAQAGIIIVDADTHRILETNNKALDLIGLPAASVIGTVCHRFICPAEKGRCPVTDLGQTVDTSERILIAADGTRIPVLKTVVPVSIGGRNLLVESFVDITQHKQSESAIREANRKLNLLSSITRHDVANQLTVVHGYTQLAEMREPDPVVKDFLKKIAASVETIQRQIEFTREYQELGVHAPAWFNIGVVIREGRPKKVRLHCSCDAFEVFADPMIGRVFYNLFDNAMKYGEHVTSITAGCRQEGEALVITFADNGVGIPLDEKQKIFEKGYGKNTGFGLFLAREILAITGMTIHETGVQGKGARFEIVVPKGIFRNKP